MTVRFPISTLQRIKNRRGKRSVSCHVSERWLRFQDEARVIDLGEGKKTYVFVNVMTGSEGEGRKLCDLCIVVEDLQAALNNVPVVND